MKKALIGTTAINQHLHLVPEFAPEILLTPDDMMPLVKDESLTAEALEGLMISKGADPDKIRAGRYLARETPDGLAVTIT